MMYLGLDNFSRGDLVQGSRGKQFEFIQTSQKFWLHGEFIVGGI